MYYKQAFGFERLENTIDSAKVIISPFTIIDLRKSLLHGGVLSTQVERRHCVCGNHTLLYFIDILVMYLYFIEKL